MKQTNDKAKLQAQIDENLKRVYQEALDERLPDRFQELLEQLRDKETTK
ncbi:MAG: transcriptional regulator [Maritimibacter sp.]|nr:transcriptional regulator [Maritimibacter sp.]